MYDELLVELTLEQVAKYLERIELFEEAQMLVDSLAENPDVCPFEPTVEFLDKLIYAHQLTVPFENLEVCDLKLPVNLSTIRLFDKIVTRSRGGYCFELNKSFNSLLKALGYKTSSHLGRIQLFAVRETPMEGTTKVSPGPPSHRINLVYISDGETEKKYLADVSFGGPQPAGAVLVEEGSHVDSLGGQFNFYYGQVNEPRGIQANSWLLTRISSSGEEQGIVSFEEYKQLEANFVSPNFFTSNNPESRFVTNRTVNLRRKDGHVLVTDDLFKLTSNGVTTEIDISDPKVRADILKEYCGIVI